MSDEINVTPYTQTPPATASSGNTATAATERTVRDQALSSILILSAVGLLISFFLPWVNILIGRPSGFDLQKLGDVHRFYWIIPIFSGVAVVAGLTKRSQRTVAVIAGLCPFAILIYWLSKLGSELMESLSYGSYVALACGLCLIVTGSRLK
jgi:hypothetical protein